MTAPEEPWYDDDAGPLVRAYAVTHGRTRPSQFLEIVSLVVTVSSTDDAPTPEHRAILRLCRRPRSVAEIAAEVDLPIGAAKVLISDLVEDGSVFVRPPEREGVTLDRQLIRTVIDGVRRL
jgi:hypothetical protein